MPRSQRLSAKSHRTASSAQAVTSASRRSEGFKRPGTGTNARVDITRRATRDTLGAWSSGRALCFWHRVRLLRSLPWNGSLAWRPFDVPEHTVAQRRDALSASDELSVHCALGSFARFRLEALSIKLCRQYLIRRSHPPWSVNTARHYHFRKSC